MADKSSKNKPFRKPPIKPVSRDVKFSKLKACECFDEADKRLRLGWSATEVARYIQGECKEYLDIQEANLCNILNEYYDSIPSIDKAVGANSTVGRKLAKQMDSQLDEVAELERLYKIQLERVEMTLTQERNVGMAFPNNGKEIWFAVKMLETSAQLKMDLGLTKRQLGQLELNGNGQVAIELGERYGRESVGKVLSNPEARRKVLGLAEKLIMLSEKAGLDAVEITKAVDAQEDRFIEVDATEVSKKEE